MIRPIFNSSLFDTIGGLPVHPLAIHAASLLIPLSAIALAILIFAPKWRAAYLPITVGALGVSVVLAFVAKESGEALAMRVGNPATHAALGDVLLPASIGLFFLGLAFYFLQKKNRPKWQIQTAAAASVAAVVAVSALTYFVGHSGAEATWANRIAQTQAQEIAVPDSKANSEVVGGIAAAEVAKHSTSSDCWTVIDGVVYDLTSYLSKHSGGASVLEAICGKDGSAAFSNQHSGEQKPAMDLSALAIGPLAASGAQPSPTPTADSSAGSSSTSTAVAALTASEVAKHNSAASCWSVVNGNVYDLTSYVSSHPGGASVITAICGKDGTAAFTGQHGSAGKAVNVLAGFKLGALAAGAAGTSSAPLPQAQVNAGEENEEEEEGDDD